MRTSVGSSSRFFSKIRRRRRRMIERWEQMTPEEREKFREGIRRWRPFQPSPPEEKA
jgi:hypothetical protein